jgi:hypothetical protein
MENNIALFFEANAITLFGVKVFTPENAQKLINLLVSNNRQIYGVDGIFVLKEGNKPSMDDSIDTSNRHKNNISLEQVGAELIRFIQDRANIKDLFFEVVFQK